MLVLLDWYKLEPTLQFGLGGSAFIPPIKLQSYHLKTEFAHKLYLLSRLKETVGFGYSIHSGSYFIALMLLKPPNLHIREKLPKLTKPNVSY